MSEITELLKELTQGYTKQQKVNFLKSLGFNSYKEIESLQDKDSLVEKLKGMLELSYETLEINLSGTWYVISRPRNPKDIRDISFNLRDGKLYVK